ncbi:MAG: PKD domain-containing protein [Runella slithyformis]|nr:MAG: PKD domain-containing protein [Runella slithyformis]TAF28266.1 MAG: PKD domain-containing protein [Runella slithyformis]TAF46955.1 MAG: PKD domain-containing protein [Runella slithyformis]TAF83083.1 MAG: PKD domain-containing protein [Runella slithyformis]
MTKKRFILRFALISLLFGVLFSNATHAQFVVGGRLCVPDPGCKSSDSTSFRDTLSTATAWQWNFGDMGGSNTSSLRNPKHVYRQAGTYRVTLRRTANGQTDSLSRQISIGQIPPPFQQWKPDTTICPGEKLPLNPYPMGAPAGAKYVWYPKGDTTQILRVDSSGCYSVEVILPNGCSYEDRTNVKICLERTNQEGAKWFFGNNAGLDFSGGAPRPITEGKLNTPEGTSAISNSKGKLLFYTDGLRVYNRDHGIMPSKDTSLLAGSPNSSQSALIVPQPTCRGCEYLYLIFTTTEINGKKQLSYSTVDMRRNGGKGEVIKKNVPLNNPTVNPTTERIVSVRNERDSTYWIVSRDFGSNIFRVYHSTPAGLQESGVFPLGQAETSPNQAEGYMKFSDRDSTGLRNLAVVVPGPPQNKVQVFKFNDSTGRIIGLPLTLNLGPAPPKAYGVEFSPDGSKMYVSMQGDSAKKAPSRLWQFDLGLKDSSRIADSKILIDSSATQIYGALQVGSDGRIYLAVKDSQFLGVINEPDQDSQREVQFVLNGINLGGKTSQLGLPNFVQNFTNESSGPGFSYADTCSNQPTTFTASPLCDPIKDTYTWNFGDGSAPVTSQQTEQKHTFAKAGTYMVSLRLVNKCKDTTITQPVTIIATPDAIKLKSPIDTCVNTLSLDAGVQAERYVWLRNGSPIARTRKLTITNAQSGTYIVLAANGLEAQCLSQGRAQITVRKPPAFSLGPDSSVCTTGSSSVELDARRGPTRWDLFKWNTGETTQKITVTKPGTYAVQVTNTSSGCVNEDTLFIKALPRARLGASLQAPTGCTTRDGSIVIGSTVPAASGYTYEWFDANNMPVMGAGSSLLNVAQGTYKVRVRGNPAACATDSAFTLRAVNNLRLQAAVVNARCTLPTSGVISLTAQSGNPTIYAWTNTTGMALGVSSPLLNNLAPGRYNVKVTDAGGCDTTLRDIAVGITQEKFLNLGPDRKRCVGDTLLLIPTLPLLAGNVYNWSTGETTPRITVNKAGSYKLTVTNPATGCTDNDELSVTLVPRPTYDLSKDVPLCDLDGGATANLVVRGGASNLSYFWFHSEEIKPRIVVNRIGTYRVRISNPEGCEVLDTARVFVRCEPRVFVPDAFSPNGDGTNEVLTIFGDHFTDFEMRIFNRWGEIIFYTNDINQKWDGSYRGSSYPPMTYPYTVSFKAKFFPERGLISQRGSVLLIR